MNNCAVREFLSFETARKFPKTFGTYFNISAKRVEILCIYKPVFMHCLVDV